MRKVLLLSFAILMGIMLSAQTQQGYVKTKGRMVDGKLVPGQGLKGASVSVHGRNTILVNSNDGTFSFPVPDAQFRLDSVRKKGYQLVDADAIGKTYGHSSNPLYLVMETPEQQLQDQLDAERRLRRTLTRQLHEREDEIEALKEQQKLTDEEYRQALQKLYDDVDQNEQLVKDMVERYSKIDYDQLSEFDQKISELILNGELTKADSMLRTKGDINQRVENYRKHEAVNAKEQAELAERQEKLEQSQALALKERDDLANDCYRKFEIFKMQHENDSAVYYIELRAGLDTTNVEWGIEAGVFNSKYIANYEKAMSYYQIALRNANEEHEPNRWTALCLSKIGVLFKKMGNYEESLKYNQEALTIQKNIFGENHRIVAKTLNDISAVYLRKRDLSQSLDYSNQALSILNQLEKKNSQMGISYNLIASVYNKMDSCNLAIKYYTLALEVIKETDGETNDLVAALYNNLAYTYNHIGDFHKALEFYQMAIGIDSVIFGKNHPILATRYDNIGVTYHELGDINNAINNAMKAMEIRETAYKGNDSEKLLSYNNVGYLYYEKKDYLTALEYYNKALIICNNYYGDCHPYTAQVFENIGGAYTGLGEYSKAIEFTNKAIKIRINIYGDSHSSLCNSYNNIGYAYYEQKDYQNALLYYGKALEICKKAYGEGHYKEASIQSNIGKIYYALEDYDNALLHYRTALKIRVSVSGEDHPKTVVIKEKISEIEAKLKEQQEKEE